MDVLTSETCWAIYNKASVIKLVNLYSNIKMVHGPIRIWSVIPSSFTYWEHPYLCDVYNGTFRDTGVLKVKPPLKIRLCLIYLTVVTFVLLLRVWIFCQMCVCVWLFNVISFKLILKLKTVCSPINLWTLCMLWKTVAVRICHGQR